MPQNVKEQIVLTDTILCSKWVGQMSDRPNGWYTNFNEVGAAQDISFFNVRNHSVGIAYNNQDARDQLPFGMRIMSIGIKFFGPATASQFTACENKGSDTLDREAIADDAYADPAAALLTNREELHTAVWEADLPNHCSIILKTNQDIRLRGPAAMFGPGYGAVGGGWGWGSPGDLQIAAQAGTPVPAISQETGGPSAGMFAGNLETVQHGEPDIRRRFPFPVPIDVPKRANLSVSVHMSNYAKEMLGAMHGPFWYPMANEFTSTVPTLSVKAAMFGIQMTIKGERLIQQRGDYHA